MSQVSITKEHEWLHFAERSGREGQEWAETFRRDHFAKMEAGQRALEQMRLGNVAQGGELLREFIDQVESVFDERGSLRAVLDRYRYGIEGYYFYVTRDFAEAEQAMRLAHAAVARAIKRANWLLLMAVNCQEFCLHRARIARNQRHWAEMQACIAEARAMMNDGIPLCETEDGQKIWWSGFKEFFAALAPLNAEETRTANNLLDPEERERLFDQWVRAMFRLPGKNIRYTS